ncbi:MAG: YdcF family protein [bacterium]|nr:YdcF family protein [bacterium]
MILPSPPTKKYDCIVILGYKFEEGIKLPIHVHERLKTALILYRNKVAPKILLSGKWNAIFHSTPIKPTTTESEEMRKILLYYNAPHHDLLKEEESTDTLENAYYLKIRCFDPLHYTRILILCADYHAERVEYIFTKVLGENFVFDILPTPTSPSTQTKMNEAESLTLESQKKLLYEMKPGDHSYLKKIKEHLP